MNSIRRQLFLTFSSVAVLCLADAAEAKPPARSETPTVRATPSSSMSLDGGFRSSPAFRFRATAPGDTTVLGSWDFDGFAGACDAQGWTSVDRNDQDEVYFHVDDFAGTAPPYAPLEGTKSMWCGARASTTNPLTCDYYALPGYGNLWRQIFRTTACLNVSGDVTVDYITRWDSEPGYDFTRLQYDACDGNWTNVSGGEFNYSGSGTMSNVIPAASHSGTMRIRFFFSSDGAFSDADGFFPSDGAFVLDSLTVSDGGGVVLPTETFETEAVGEHLATSGNWEGTVPDSYGDFAALFPGGGVLQEDACTTNLSCLWGFFSGSTADYACGGHPGQPAVPYQDANGQFLWNEIWSPVIPLAGAGNKTVLEFDVYGDTPIENLVFYQWWVRSIVAGCPERWDGDNTAYSIPRTMWAHHTTALNDYLVPGAPSIQVALTARDLCVYWCGYYGLGDCHSHAPLFDNVRVVAVDTDGPDWEVTTENLFVDGFPADGTTTGTVHADVGALPGDLPTDAGVVRVHDYTDGIAQDPRAGGGPGVYVCVAVWPDQPGKRGAALSDDAFNHPVVDSLSAAGRTWYMVRMTDNFKHRYGFDLADNLFTPGDTVSYFFAAQADTPSSVVTYWSEFTATTHDLEEVASNPMEFTCLPTGAGDILYIDGFDGDGAQPFYDTAFDAMGLTGQVDRFDTRARSDGRLDASITRRMVDPIAQLSPYRKIIWDTGNDNAWPFAVVVPGQRYLDDFGTLYNFLANLDTTGGVYLAGNDAAEFWNAHNADGVASAFRTDYMNHTLVAGNHRDAGFGESPLVIGAPGGCFDHGGDTDTLLAFGGCSIPSRFTDAVEFDVLAPAGAAATEASYASGGPAGAVLSQRTTNPLGHEVGVVLSGFSLSAVRDMSPDGVPARAEHLYDVIVWLGNQPTAPTDARPGPYRYALSQNVPNPFNPSTRIRYSVAESRRVRVVVYNVRGQRVRTLVDREVVPGAEQVVEWDGRNDAGQRVATGVYFCRMTAGTFTQTRKMVLLK